jgi:hypothetical protein
MFVEGLGDWKTPITAVVKAAPTKIRLGGLNTPMPTAYANSVGLQVTVMQTGWPSLDDKTFIVSAWQDGGASTFPDLTLAGSDTTGETGANPPRSDMFVYIRPIIANFARYPKP